MRPITGPSSRVPVNYKHFAQINTLLLFGPSFSQTLDQNIIVCRFESNLSIFWSKVCENFLLHAEKKYRMLVITFCNNILANFMVCQYVTGLLNILLKFVFFEKATKFDEISILLLTNKFVFLCFPPNFEFSVSYSSSLSGAP